jgi:hypothetical protein
MVKSNPFIPGDDVFWTEMIHGIHTIVYYSSSSQTRAIIGLGSVGHCQIPPYSESRIIWIQ